MKDESKLNAHLRRNKNAYILMFAFLFIGSVYAATVITDTNSNFGGTITATQFIGDGSLLTGISSTSSNFNGSQLNSGLVVYLALDENGRTSTGNVTYNSAYANNNGSTRNASAICNPGSADCTQWTPGVSYSALKFDGINDNLQLENSASEIIKNNTNISFAFWYRSDGAGSSGGNIFAMSATGTPGNRIRVFFSGDGSGQQNLSIQMAGATITNGTYPVNQGQWYHVTGSYDFNNRMTAYINGVNVGSNLSQSSGNVADICLGANDCTGATPSNVTIDEFRIYNRTLNADEVKALYLGLGGPGTGQFTLK